MGLFSGGEVAALREKAIQESRGNAIHGNAKKKISKTPEPVIEDSPQVARQRRRTDQLRRELSVTRSTIRKLQIRDEIEQAERLLDELLEREEGRRM